MAIQINYSNSSGAQSGLNVLRTQGLKAYFQHYENNFAAAQVDPDLVEQAGQAFSTDISTQISAGFLTNPTQQPMAAFSDAQYGGNTSLSTGSGSAFIAEVSDASGLQVGQLAYTLFYNPAHVLFGELDTVYLGDQATLANVSNDLHTMDLPVVDISNLNSELNGGIKQNGLGQWKAIDHDEGLVGGTNTDTSSIWYGTSYGNDTHNIVYDLMSNHGLVSGPKETAALQHVLNWSAFDLDHNGTVYNEVFDGFAGKDTFKVGGGDGDVIRSFDPTQDIVQVTTSYNHSTPADVLANSFDGTYNGESGVYVYDDFFGISNFTFLVGISTTDLSSGNFAIG